MNVLITGKDGQLGKSLLEASQHFPVFTCDFVGREEMDLSDNSSITQVFNNKKYDYVIHTAAYTAVDKAEEEEELAYKINAEAVHVIASICARQKIRLLFISTDYVFEGRFIDLLDESHVPNPISVYGKSKWKAEKFVQSIVPDAYIIRTSWVYSPFGKNFVKTILRLSGERERIQVIADQIGSPTYAADLADVIFQIVSQIEHRLTDIPGIYHYSNEGAISWFDFAQAIVELSNRSCVVDPIKTSEYAVAAKRPAFSVLDKRKIKTMFDITIPYWRSSLRDCLTKLSNE